MTHTTDTEAQRLVLLAAVSLLRGGEPDAYVVARLAQAGYTREHVKTMAAWLADDASVALDAHRRPQVTT